MNPRQYFTDDEQASSFSKFRPYYGDDLYQRILKYHQPKGDHSNLEFALDVGCGTGQSTVSLARYFKKVLGVDISPAQIRKAPKGIHNVSFMIGDAENLRALVPARSVDLLTVGQTLHWLNREKFFSEAKYVLKVNGTITIYNYEERHMADPEAEKIMQEFEKKLAPYKEKTLENLAVCYDVTHFPFDDIERVDDLQMEREYTPHALRGYLRSLSYYQMYLNDHPNSGELDNLMKNLEPLFISADGYSRLLKMTWQFTLILGRFREE